MRIANEIFMYFRSKKKEGLEVSLNDTIDIDRDGNPLTYMDIISVDDNIAENLDMKMHTDRISMLVENKLEKREKEIIVLRYGLRGCEPKTQREVADFLGISRSYVSRIEKKALLTLRSAFGDATPDFDD